MQLQNRPLAVKAEHYASLYKNFSRDHFAMLERSLRASAGTEFGKTDLYRRMLEGLRIAIKQTDLWRIDIASGVRLDFKKGME